jgi:hypothetical protein
MSSCRKQGKWCRMPKKRFGRHFKITYSLGRNNFNFTFANEQTARGMCKQAKSRLPDHLLTSVACMAGLITAGNEQIKQKKFSTPIEHVFHGTPPRNLDSIQIRSGMDPTLRRRGCDYFATAAEYSLNYASPITTGPAHWGLRSRVLSNAFCRRNAGLGPQAAVFVFYEQPAAWNIA